MSHIQDLSGPLFDWFNRMQTGAFLPKAIFSGNVTPIGGTVPVYVVWDLSDSMKADGIKINQTKPVIPGKGVSSQFLASRATVTLINDGNQPYIGTTQDGSIMDMATIETGELKLECGFAGITDRIALFTGRVKGPPVEEEGKTTFEIYDLTFENITHAVKFDNFAEFTNNGTQNSGTAGNGNFLNPRRFIQSLLRSHYVQRDRRHHFHGNQQQPPANGLAKDRG